MIFFFFSSRRRHTRCYRDWSSDVCSSDLVDAALIHPPLGWDPDANVLAVEAARKYPARFAVMGQFRLDDPANRKLIHGWRDQPGMMGLRWPLLLAEQQKWLTDGSLD